MTSSESMITASMFPWLLHRFDFLSTHRHRFLPRAETELHFIARDGVVNHLCESFLPPPLHLAMAFNRISCRSPNKWAIARGIRRLCRWKTEPIQSFRFLDWLQRRRQTPDAIERLLECPPDRALSETLDRIDIGHARKVIVDGFLRNRISSMQVPTISLDELSASTCVAGSNNKESGFNLNAVSNGSIFPRKNPPELSSGMGQISRGPDHSGDQSNPGYRFVPRQNLPQYGDSHQHVRWNRHPSPACISGSIVKCQLRSLTRFSSASDAMDLFSQQTSEPALPPIPRGDATIRS